MRRSPRYLIVVAIGFGIDLGLALILNRVFGVDLTLAAATGFTAALLLNYLLFESWAFPQRQIRLSVRRLLATLASAVITLVVRLIAVTGLGLLVDASHGRMAAVVLVLAAGLSLVVNWVLISRIFARETDPP